MGYEFSRGESGVSKRTEGLISRDLKRAKIDISSGAEAYSATNIELFGGHMRSVEKKSDIGAISEKYSGEAMIKAKCESDGITIMRINDSLYAKSGSAVMKRISSGCFSSEKTVIFYFNGDFYATNGGALLKITKSYKVTTVEPYIPTVYNGINPSGTQYVAYESPNVICDYAYLEYTSSSSFSTIYFPSVIEVASVELIKNKKTGSKITSYTTPTLLGDLYISFNSTISAGTYTIKVKLGENTNESVTSLSMFEAARSALFESSLICELDVSTDKHGSFYGMCNDSERFYVFNANDMAYITRDAIWYQPIDIKPTAMAEYSGGELVFSENKIVFVKTTISDGGDAPYVNISKTIIKRDFGCDMPWSAVAFDNKIIFGNSKNGIYYINKFGLSERDGSCLISLPIAEMFNGHSVSDLRAARAVCTANAYYISIGGTLMAFSFESGLPTGTSESYEKKMRYSWAERGDVSSCEFISVIGDEIYLLEHSDVTERMINAENGDLPSVIKSRALDLGTSEEKVMSHLNIVGGFSGDVTIRLAFDGKMADTIFKITPQDKDVRRYRCAVPRERFCFTEIWISCASSAVINEVEAEYYAI